MFFGQRGGTRGVRRPRLQKGKGKVKPQKEKIGKKRGQPSVLETKRRRSPNLFFPRRKKEKKEFSPSARAQKVKVKRSSHFNRWERGLSSLHSNLEKRDKGGGSPIAWRYEGRRRAGGLFYYEMHREKKTRGTCSPIEEGGRKERREERPFLCGGGIWGEGGGGKEGKRTTFLYQLPKGEGEKRAFAPPSPDKVSG